jgi:thiamine transport system substrate-binding protein
MTASSPNGVPGPKIEAAFEANCDCDLKWVGVADGVALLNRLKLEGDKAEAGLVLGLDTNLVAEAKATGLFEAHGLDTAAFRFPAASATIPSFPMITAISP